LKKDFKKKKKKLFNKTYIALFMKENSSENGRVGKFNSWMQTYIADTRNGSMLKGNTKTANDSNLKPS